MKLNRRSLLKAGTGALLLSAWGTPTLLGQEGVETLTIPLESFGWSNWIIAKGSFSYKPVADAFEVSVNASGLRASHTYELQLISFDPVGNRIVNRSSFDTDSKGKIDISVRNERVAEAKMPMFQIHAFIVDPEETGPPKTPASVMGITQGAPLACSYPAGFRLQN